MDRVYEAYHGQWGGNRVQFETRLRMNWLSKNAVGTRILDIGCSQGILEELILNNQPDVFIFAIDLDPNTIDFAQLQVGKKFEEQVNFKCINLFDMCRTGDFDTVILGQILEHVDCPRDFLSYSAGFLRNSARMLITVPYGVWDHEDHLHIFYCRDLQDALPKGLYIQSLSLQGARLAAVLVQDESAALSDAEIAEKELSFFKAKERRYLENGTTRIAKLNTLQQRVQRLTELQLNTVTEADRKRKLLEQRIAVLQGQIAALKKRIG